MGIVSAPADDALSTSGLPWEVSRTVFRLWMRPLRGVVIALIDCAHQLFTYPNEFLVTVGHRGSDKRGSTLYIWQPDCDIAHSKPCAPDVIVRLLLRLLLLRNKMSDSEHAPIPSGSAGTSLSVSADQFTLLMQVIESSHCRKNEKFHHFQQEIRQGQEEVVARP